METTHTYKETSGSDPKAPVALEQRDWMLLAVTALCAGLYAFAQPSIISSGFLHFPGVGMTFSVWLLIAACTAHIGRHSLHWTGQSLFLLVATLLLSLTYSVFANDGLRLMNLPVLAVLSALTVISLASGVDCLSARGFSDALRQSCRASLKHVPAPLRALLSLRRCGDSERPGALFIGLFLCIPIVGLAALLLCDADADFGAALAGLILHLRTPSLGETVWALLRALALTLLLFAFFYGLKRGTPCTKSAPARRTIRLLSLEMVLMALCVLYAAFVCLQFQHLLRGTNLLRGSYAGNARTGFFQLVIVSLISIAVILPSLCAHPESRGLRILSALVTLLTAGILASAVWRMAVYIQAYGWTLLRMTTLWGMLAIAAALTGAIVKCLRPNTRIFKALAIFTIVSWTLFNYSNVDARIAEANVTAYQHGAQEALDVGYLSTLSPDVLSALDALDASVTDLGLIDDIARAKQHLQSMRPNWYDWSLSWRKLP